MIKDLKNEMTNFISDLEKNINDKEELLYLKERTAKLFNVVVEELENAVNYKANEIQKLEKKQIESDDRLDEIEEVLKDITRDIYDDEEDFEIICPYCNNEFDADIDETKTEIVCPECQNVIELDWGLDQNNSNCGGNCSGCGGCNDDNENKK